MQAIGWRALGTMVLLACLATATAAAADAERTVDRLHAAYRAGSVQGMLGVYADDAVFEDVNQRHRFAGTEELTLFLTQIVSLHDVIGLREIRRIVRGDTVVVEYEYTGILNGEALSQLVGKEGCPDLEYSLPVTSWYQVRNGRITHQKDFIDLATFQELQARAASASGS